MYCFRASSAITRKFTSPLVAGGVLSLVVGGGGVVILVVGGGVVSLVVAGGVVNLVVGGGGGAGRFGAGSRRSVTA